MLFSRNRRIRWLLDDILLELDRAFLKICERRTRELRMLKISAEKNKRWQQMQEIKRIHIIFYHLLWSQIILWYFQSTLRKQVMVKAPVNRRTMEYQGEDITKLRQMQTKDRESWFTIVRTTDSVETLASFMTELNCMNTITANSEMRMIQGTQSQPLEAALVIFNSTPFRMMLDYDLLITNQIGNMSSWILLPLSNEVTLAVLTPTHIFFSSLKNPSRLRSTWIIPLLAQMGSQNKIVSLFTVCLKGADVVIYFRERAEQTMVQFPWVFQRKM